MDASWADKTAQQKVVQSVEWWGENLAAATVVVLVAKLAYCSADRRVARLAERKDATWAVQTAEMMVDSTVAN